MDLLDEYLGVRVSSKDKARIMAAAEDARLGVASFIRSEIMKTVASQGY